jgi:predicted restriction endonuclease
VTGRYGRSVHRPLARRVLGEHAEVHQPPLVGERSAEVSRYERRLRTGLRILLPGGEAMVEAAHIHPFAEAGDDDPRNGIALTPDMHWAMDRQLIAPGPDLRWHVSARLDRRIPDFERLCSLEGRELLLPTEPRLYPKREALAWRVGQLQ